jgi:hypothetical protein
MGRGRAGGLDTIGDDARGLKPASPPPTPTMVDFNGFLGFGASIFGAGGAIGGAREEAAIGGLAGATGGALGGAAAAGLAGAAGFAAGKSEPGVVTRNECPHLGHRIFRPAGGTRRSSI